MNCYDCATTGTYRDAVAICADCGAAVCTEHAVTAPHWLTRTQTIMLTERVEPPARVIRCGTCHAAHAARGDIADTMPARSSAR